MLAQRTTLQTTMAPPEKTTYISSTGQLSAPPLTKRIADAVSDMAEIGWLFFDTLFTVSPFPTPYNPRPIPYNLQPAIHPTAVSRGFSS